MIGPDSKERRAAVSSMVVAGLVVAAHVASQATRDALFLSAFPATYLPRMIAVAAILSLVAVFASAKSLRIFGPDKVVAVICATNGAAFLAEAVYFDKSQELIAIVVFLHVSTLSAVLVSAIWSQVIERFNPRTARKVVARVEASAAFGGVIGGVASERLADATSLRALLLFLGGLMTIATAVSLGRIERRSFGPQEMEEQVTIKALVSERYLVKVAVLVFLMAISTTLLDYVFKAEAKNSVSSGVSLARLFAIYYTVVSVLTFLLQSLAGEKLLRLAGPAGAAATLPVTLFSCGVAILAMPGFWGASITRGLTSVLEKSFFKSGYETFYVPIDAAKKRMAKAAIDVGLDKLGDGLGAGLVLLTFLFFDEVDHYLFVALAVVFSVAILALLSGMREDYIHALGNNLKKAPVPDSSIPSHPSLTGHPPLSDELPESEIVELLDELHTHDPQRVERALRGGLRRPLIGDVIELLGNERCRSVAERTLANQVESVCGQLTDVLLDEGHSFKIRGRIPRLFRFARSSRAAEGMLAALRTEPTSIRFRASHYLAEMIENCPQLTFDNERVFEEARFALSQPPSTFDGAELLDDGEDDDGDVATSAKQTLQHVFAILRCGDLDRDALRHALGVLMKGSRDQQGTAVEYLDELLPGDIRDLIFEWWESSDSDGPRSHDAAE